MQQVDVSVVTDRPSRALKLAKRMPPDAELPVASRARHLADVAFAQTAKWVRYQPYTRLIVGELLERERRARTPGLRGLARRLSVA
jgi:hypothetical protein